MLRKLRPRSAYDIMAALALFLVVTGGTAFAVVAANQVNSASIIDGQVKNQDLAPNSVGTGKVIDHTLTGNDLATGAVNSAALADGAVTSPKIAAGAVGAGQLAPGAVGSGALADSSVHSQELGAFAVTGEKIALGTITGDRLAQGTITSREIKVFGVGASRIAPNAVTHVQVADKAIGTDEIRSLPGARIGRSTDQGFPDNHRGQFLNFTQETYDPNNMHTSSDLSALKISVAGRYLISTNAQFGGSGTVVLSLTRNGSEIDFAATDLGGLQNFGVPLEASTIDSLNAGDKIQTFVGFSKTGSTSDKSIGTPDTPILAVQWLGPN